MLKFQSWHQPPQHLISIYQPYDLLMHPHYQIQWLSGHPSWQSLIDIPWTNGITLQPCTTFRGCQMGQHKVGQYLTESESIAICFKRINYILNQIKLWMKGVLTIMHDIVVTSAINQWQDVRSALQKSQKTVNTQNSANNKFCITHQGDINYLYLAKYLAQSK